MTRTWKRITNVLRGLLYTVATHHCSIKVCSRNALFASRIAETFHKSFEITAPFASDKVIEILETRTQSIYVCMSTYDNIKPINII